VSARRAASRAPVPIVQTPKVADAKTQRALDTVVAAVQQLQAKRSAAAVSVTGSRAGGDAFENLLTALAGLGIITDDTEA
jgi:hypothetical protein